MIIGPEHAATIAASGWSRLDVRSYLWMNAGNTWGEISFNDRYAGGGKVYNKALPKWYKRETGARIPIVEKPDDIHLFVAGGAAGRFSAFIPGWGRMTSPVLRKIDGVEPPTGADCMDGSCAL